MTEHLASDMDGDTMSVPGSPQVGGRARSARTPDQAIQARRTLKPVLAISTPVRTRTKGSDRSSSSSSLSSGGLIGIHGRAGSSWNFESWKRSGADAPLAALDLADHDLVIARLDDAFEPADEQRDPLAEDRRAVRVELVRDRLEARRVPSHERAHRMHLVRAEHVDREAAQSASRRPACASRAGRTRARAADRARRS